MAKGQDTKDAGSAPAQQKPSMPAGDLDVTKAKAASAKGAVKMYSPRGDCHIGLTTGHTMVVVQHPDGVEVPKAFRREALARGCLPVGMTDDDLGSGQTFDRAAVIRSKMEAMLNSDDPAYFSGDGKPTMAVLSRLCGFTVERGERDRVWAEVEAGVNSDDD